MDTKILAESHEREPMGSALYIRLGEGVTQHSRNQYCIVLNAQNSAYSSMTSWMKYLVLTLCSAVSPHPQTC